MQSLPVPEAGVPNPVSAGRVPRRLWDGASQASRQLPAAAWLVTAPLPALSLCGSVSRVTRFVDTGRGPRGPRWPHLNVFRLRGAGSGEPRRHGRPWHRLRHCPAPGRGRCSRPVPEVPAGPLGAARAGAGPPAPSDSATRPERNQRLRRLAGGSRGDRPAEEVWGDGGRVGVGRGTAAALPRASREPPVLSPDEAARPGLSFPTHR